MKASLLVWIFQSGEPLQTDNDNARPMRAMNLSNALVKAGHRVVLWSSAFHHLEKRHRSQVAASFRLNESLEIRLVPSRGYQKNIGAARLLDHAQMACNLRKMVKKDVILPDAAFIGFPPIETAAFLAPWLSRRLVPVLLDVKDQWPEMFLDAFPKRFRTVGKFLLAPYFTLARRAMQAATGISGMANGYIDWATGFAGRKQNGLDAVFPLTSPSRGATDAQLADAHNWCRKQGFLKDRATYILFAGTFNSVFDFKPVLESARLFMVNGSRVEFILCGDGGFAGEVRKMMSGLPNVHFPGWVSRPKIEALAEISQAMIAPYQNIDYFIRSIPNKICDVLSLGLPILCPLQGEVAALIAEYGVGMRYGTDTGKSLHDCILSLMQDTSLQQSMSRKARALYQARFSFEMVYGGLVRHLENMAQNAGKK